MSPENTRELVAAVLGVLTAATLALVNGWIYTRASVDDDLRTQRLKVYQTLWQATRTVSRWPRFELTRTTLGGLHETLRAWHCTEGGIFLSESGVLQLGDTRVTTGAP